MHTAKEPKRGNFLKHHVSNRQLLTHASKIKTQDHIGYHALK